MWKPAPLFEVARGEISKFWIYNYDPLNIPYETIWAFPEWAKNPYKYYDRLTDCEDVEVEIFKKYKTLMDLEFPNPSVNLTAEILDDTWLMCPNCIDAWESTSQNGMVICPKCHNMMHNPRWTEPFEH
jgi:hypothetical protein